MPGVLVWMLLGSAAIAGFLAVDAWLDRRAARKDVRSDWRRMADAIEGRDHRE